MAFITAEIKAQFKPCGFYRNLSLCLIWSQKLKKDSFIGQLSTLRLVEVCCSGARFTKQYNEPEKTLFPSCIRRFICEWTEVSRHASRVWFVQCHHPLLQPPPPFVTHIVIFFIVFHAFSVLIGQKGCTAQDGEGKWKSPSAGSFKYLRERATSWAGNRKCIHLTWFPVKSKHFQI